MTAVQQTALSALRAFSTKIQSNSNNIANANTDGFKKSRVTNAAVNPARVAAQVEKISTPGPIVPQQTGENTEMVELSNVDLATELVDMSVNSTLYKANLKTLETANDMTGSLLRLKS